MRSKLGTRFLGCFSMTVFAVHHTTTYRYKNPIRPGLHQLMFRPRDSFDQRLLDCHLKISPEPAETRWIHDVFGNCVTLVDFATPPTKAGMMVGLNDRVGSNGDILARQSYVGFAPESRHRASAR